MNRISIATFNHRPEAEALQQRLIENGVRAEVHDELKLEKFWFVSRPATGVRLEVPAQQFELAHHLLLRWDTDEGVLRDAVHCPDCGSIRVYYPQHTRRSLIPNLVVGTLAAVVRMDKEYYCDDCHFTWPKEPHKDDSARPHMAPYYFIEDVGPTATATPAEPKPTEG